MTSWLILGPSCLLPDAAEETLFNFGDRVVQQQAAAGRVTEGLEVSLLGETAESQGAFLECQIVTHCDTTWEDLLQR